MYIIWFVLMIRSVDVDANVNISISYVVIAAIFCVALKSASFCWRAQSKDAPIQRMLNSLPMAASLFGFQLIAMAGVSLSYSSNADVAIMPSIIYEIGVAIGATIFIAMLLGSTVFFIGNVAAMQAIFLKKNREIAKLVREKTKLTADLAASELKVYVLNMFNPNKPALLFHNPLYRSVYRLPPITPTYKAGVPVKGVDYRLPGRTMSLEGKTKSPVITRSDVTNNLILQMMIQNNEPLDSNSIGFMKHVDAWKRVDVESPLYNSFAHYIYYMFIEVDSISEINVNGEVRKQIKARIQTTDKIDIGVFDKVYSECFRLVNSNNIPRLLNISEDAHTAAYSYIEGHRSAAVAAPPPSPILSDRGSMHERQSTTPLPGQIYLVEVHPPKLE